MQFVPKYGNRNQSFLQYVRILAFLYLFIDLPSDAVAGADPSGASSGSPPCSVDGSDGISPTDDSTDDTLGKFFRMGDSCLKVSGSIQVTGQMTNASGSLLSSGGSTQLLSASPDIRIETATPTRNGLFKTAFEVEWDPDTSSGIQSLPSSDEMTLSYMGYQVGYTDSLMNFWDGDFQFTASAPSLSTYLLSKEFALSDELKLAFAVEAGPPSSKGAGTWALPGTPPYYSMRLRYEHDDWTWHFSAAAHEVEVSRTPAIAGSGHQIIGWASSVGVTIPFAFVAENDEASVQLVYALNSSVFLGTAGDKSALANLVPSGASLPNNGWSAVASYHHDWNDSLGTNIFVSHVALELEDALATPSVHMNRVGANLIYQITPNWQTGAELGLLNAQIDVNSGLGSIHAASITSETGYLWVKWEF
jgi:hypothetical protein